MICPHCKAEIADGELGLHEVLCEEREPRRVDLDAPSAKERAEMEYRRKYYGR